MNSKDIYNSVCEIITKSEKYISNGTCFLYENNSILYAISNKHIIYGDKGEKIKLSLKLNVKNKNTNQSYVVEKTIPILENNIIKEEKYDISAYPIECIKQSIENDNYELDHYIIKSSDIMFDYDDLDYIEEIFCVGYPCGFKDSVTNRPIITKGISATPIQANLENLDVFLGDITNYGGNSGSPVFIKINNIYKLVGISYGMLHKPINVKNVVINSQKIENIKGEIESLFNICVKSKILKNIFR